MALKRKEAFKIGFGHSVNDAHAPKPIQNTDQTGLFEARRRSEQLAKDILAIQKMEKSSTKKPSFFKSYFRTQDERPPGTNSPKRKPKR